LKDNMLQIIIIALAVAADQLTKFLLVPMLQSLPGQTLTVIPGVFSLTYTGNTGASFGILAGAQPFFIAVTIIILIAGTVVMIRTRKKQSSFLKICLSLIIGGAVGNFADRVTLGYVRDIFDFHAVYFPWIFNVADSCLVVGAILLGIYVIFIYKPKDKKAQMKEGKNPSEE